MKKMIFIAFAAAFALSACGKQDGPRNLSHDDIARANALAKQYFAQKHKGMYQGQTWEVEGVLFSCNGVDSNANGLTSCYGSVPDATGKNLVKQTMYCGYSGEINACQPNDLIAGK